MDGQYMNRDPVIPIKRYTTTELNLRNAELGIDDDHWYDDEELDTMELTYPMQAVRSAQRQAKVSRSRSNIPIGDAPPLTTEGLTAVLEEARAVLLRDGGALEQVDFHDNVVRVRLKGACTGCPNSVLDLKNVVEKIVRKVYPQVTDVLT